MPTTRPITVVLGDIKTLMSRRQKTGEAIRKYAFHPSNVVDPFAKDGGSEKYVEGLIQSYNALNDRLVTLRTIILEANLINTLTIHGVNKSVQGWLTWRREVMDEEYFLFSNLIMATDAKRNEISRFPAQGENVITLIVNFNESKINEAANLIQKINDDLDTQLSLFNALTLVEVPD
jgi:hypothetical protein